MLELRHVTFTIKADGEDRDLLHDVSLTAPSRHFMAIVGPSGCGKSTLLKMISGMIPESDGGVFWKSRNLAEEGDLEPWELGYVPQFSIAYDHLTVEESIESAIKLRVRCGADEREEILEYVLRDTGLDPIRDRFVKILSGGQKRRLGLAMELVSDPNVLLCDEVTSGLDPKSEQEIVKLMHHLSRENPDRVVINVTHSLSNLDLYDSVLVMHEGRIAYHGPTKALCHYFNVKHPEEIYPSLSRRNGDSWHQSWEKHRANYYEKFKIGKPPPPLENPLPAEESNLEGEAWVDQGLPPPKQAAEPEPRRESLRSDRPGRRKKSAGDAAPSPRNSADTGEVDNDSPEDVDEEEEAPDPIRMPGFFSQFFTLLQRRWTIFFRDKTQIILHLAMMIGFPFIVIIFALDGIGDVHSLSQHKDTDIIARLSQEVSVREQQVKVGGLISGLIMFQVILLTLMGANNSAREIASERLILEKEKLGGVRPLSYLASKVIFLAVLVTFQSAWMTFFVDTFIGSGGLPGGIGMRFALLWMVTAAMTAVCLGLSAIMRTPEQATLLSIYLVGFQLPLSGAVLRLPQWLEPIVQPTIAAFWSWSGCLKNMEGSNYYGAIRGVTETDIIDPRLALYVLGFHILAGLLVGWIGTRRSRWD